MDYSKYVGHASQISGVEEMTLSKGKGKGMTLLEIRNGKGLNFTLSEDRAMDISRMNFNGINMGFFASCGYVAPTYYDDKGAGFLKSFTAGFMTTCGLAAAGTAHNDNGEDLPLHGTISHIPCENYSYSETEDEIIIEATIIDAPPFKNKYQLSRKYICSKLENTLVLEDTVKNIGSNRIPIMILYHFNMGYPLLSENAIVKIPNNSMKPRAGHAETGVDNALVMEKPQENYAEMCFFYDVKENDGVASVGIFNPDINKGLKMSFDKDTLDYFTEWKMMREYDYALGLEPANCTPDGRAVMREEGTLRFIDAGEEYKTRVKLEFTECEDIIKSL